MFLGILCKFLDFRLFLLNVSEEEFLLSSCEGIEVDLCH